MVHNGIEYGLMAAYAEGLNILKNADAGTRQREADAETAPLREPKYYQYDLDLADVAEVWRRGSVIGSWLLDLIADALLTDPELAQFGGRVSDSGEGRWTIMAAIDQGVPAHVLSLGAVRPVHLARPCRLRRQADVGDALRVRRPCREAVIASRAGPASASQSAGPTMTEPRSDAFVLFGATGDLAHKKMFPSLYAMVRRGQLKEPVVGVAFDDWTVDQLRERARDGIQLSEGARRREGLRRSSPSCSAT